MEDAERVPSVISICIFHVSRESRSRVVRAHVAYIYIERVCIYIYMCVHIYIYIHVYIECVRVFEGRGAMEI